MSVKRPNNIARKSRPFSIYDIASNSTPSEETEDLQHFIDRVSGAPSKPIPPQRRTLPLRQVVTRDAGLADAGRAITTLEKALVQEREVSDALRKRVVELEISASKPAIPRLPQGIAPVVNLPLPVPSTMSEWRQRLEEVQKRQLEKMVGRGGVNITI